MATTRGVTRLWRLDSRFSVENGANVLVLQGRLGHLSVGNLRAAAEAAMAQGDKDLVIDLEGVDYLSGAAIKVFEELVTEQAVRGRELTLRSPSPAARLSLELAGLSARTK
jgi:anti-anti-sigma factor